MLWTVAAPAHRVASAGIDTPALNRMVYDMTHKNIAPDNRRAKQALFQGKTRSRINRRIIWAVVAVIVAVSGIAYVAGTRSQSTASAISIATVERPSNGGLKQISYPLSLFDDGKAHHFEYKTEESTIRFFMIKGADGIIRSAFDACDVCWPAGKGYVQAADAMICIHCNRRFPVSRINKDQGGCNPAPLNRTVQEDQVVIQVQDILPGKRYFNFKQKG